MVKPPGPLARRPVLKAVAAVPLLGALPRVRGTQETVSVTESDETVRIENEAVGLTFLRGNGGLYQLRDKRAGFELRNTATDFPETLWSVRFYHGPDEGNLLTSSYLSNAPTFEVSPESDRATVSIRWEDAELKAPPLGPLERTFEGTVTVDVTVRAGEPFARFAIDVANDSPDLDVKEVICPDVTSVGRLASDGSDAVINPTHLGRRHPDPTSREHAPHHIYPSGFGTMQFSAYLGPEGGFYTDARDTEGYVKSIVWEPEPALGVLNYKLAHRETMDPGADVSRPYETTLGVVRGDWYDAADRYRAWLDAEGWLDGAKRHSPDWLLDLGATYRVEMHPENGPWDYPIDEAAELVREKQAYLDVPLQFQAAQWQGDGDGDWLPPRDGWDAFERALRSLLDEEIRSDVFVSGTFYGKDASLFDEDDGATDWITRTREGDLATFGDSGGSFYVMESTNDGWQSFVRDVIRKLVDAGIREVQYDGIPFNLLGCYAEDHDHEPGRGGNWFGSGCRRNVAELGQMMADNGEGALSGEGTCDFLLPFLDVHNTRDVFAEYLDPEVKAGTGEVIPLQPYTFGDVQAIRNQNHEPVGLAPELDRLFSARALLWGAVPVFRFPEAVPDDPPGALHHFRRVARARAHYGNRFVARGELLRRPNVETDTVELRGHRGVATETATVQSCAWASDTSEIGVFLLNVSPDDDDRTVRYDPAAQPYSPVAGDTTRYVVRNGTYERVVADAGPVDLTVTPDDVVLLVEAPAGDGRRAALERIVEAEREVDGPAERDTLATAKSAFEAGDFDSALSGAEAVVVGTPSEPSRDGQPTADGTTTEADADGFGVAAAVTALGGYLLSSYRSIDEDE